MKQQNLAKHGLWVLVLGFALSACWGKKEEEVPADTVPTSETVPADGAAAPADAPPAADDGH